jgi:hypothetical protein
MNHRANPRIALSCFFLFLLCVCATARGEEAAGVYFQHGDWEIACDNTLTCRIAGYCAEKDYESGCGSVLITRAAGPNAPLKGKMMMENYRGRREILPTPRLRVNGQAKDKLKRDREFGVFLLAPAQIRALLAAARQDGAVEFVEENDGEFVIEVEPRSFTLSGKGISAVLLKADEVQGRVGTPGALIRKGKKPEKAVFPPRPLPVIRAAKVISDAPEREPTATEIAALTPLLRQNKKVREDCDAAYSQANNPFELMPLDDRHILIAMPCWRETHENAYGFLVMDSALKGTPQLVTTEAGGYAPKSGVITAYAVWQGDCQHGLSSDWIWDGQAFRLSSQWTSGMCRRIRSADGTWPLPIFVTRVINADGTPSRLNQMEEQP